MKRSWWYRFSFLLVLVVVSVVSIVPTVFNYNEESNYPVKSKINLGLDLQGGLYMILGIDFKKVYRDEVKGYARRIEFILNDEGFKSQIGDLDATDVEDPKHSITLDDINNVEKAKDKIKEKKGEASHGVLVVEDSDEGNTSNFVGNNDANAANNRVLKFSNKQKPGQVMVV